MFREVLRPLTQWRRVRPPDSNPGPDAGSLLLQSLSRPIPEHARAPHLLGVAAALLGLVLAATGILLALYYQPSVEGARRSVLLLSSEVTLGWLVRGMHAWSARLLLLVLLLHLARVLWARAYEPPRGANWGVGVLLLGVVLAFLFTGHALPVDRSAYWAAVGEARLVASLPGVGGGLRTLLYGGASVSTESVSRLFTLHALLLPWIAFGLLFLHIYLVRKQGLKGGRS